jgi:hypothetical protein
MARKTTDKSDDLGADEVQAKVDEAEAKGYLGEVPDPTPNSAYTVGGVTSGAPTPETDPDLAPARSVQADVRTSPARKK